MILYRPMLHIALWDASKDEGHMSKIYTAAMVVIGNEILSGRTQDKNINYVANKMVEVGVTLSEVRVIPDVAQTIIDTVRELSAKFDYVFTSGGIGPTHDDITAENIAAAFNVALEQNEEAYALLLDHYGEADLTEARLKMGQIPVGAELVPNPVSAAPGFRVENVYVLAGVPRIIQAMIDHVARTLKGGAVIQSRTVPCTHPESAVAQGLGEIQNQYSTVDIGSYPHFKAAQLGVNVVLRSSDEGALNAAERDVIDLIAKMA